MVNCFCFCSQSFDKEIDKQRPSVENLREKAGDLSKSDPDSKMADKVNEVLKMFDALAENVKVNPSTVCQQHEVKLSFCVPF